MTVFQRSLMSRFECPGKQTNWSHEWLKFSRGFRQSSMPCSQSDAGAEVTSRRRALLLLKCRVGAVTSWTSRQKTPQAALECVTLSSPSPIVASTSFGVFSFLRFVYAAYGERTEEPKMGEDIGRRSQGSVRERSPVWQHERFGTTRSIEMCFLFLAREQWV